MTARGGLTLGRNRSAAVFALLLAMTSVGAAARGAGSGTDREASLTGGGPASGRAAVNEPSYVPAAAAQDAQPSPAPWPAIVRSLEGSWEGSGTLFGNPAAFSMEWVAALDGRFVRLRFSNALVRDEGTTPVIAAEAFYRVEEGARLGGYWFDSRGLIVTLSAAAESDRVVADWSAPGVESGQTTYRLVDADTVEVVDLVRTEQGLREFGRATYRRRS